MIAIRPAEEVSLLRARDREPDSTETSSKQKRFLPPPPHTVRLMRTRTIG